MTDNRVDPAFPVVETSDGTVRYHGISRRLYIAAQLAAAWTAAGGTGMHPSHCVHAFTMADAMIAYDKEHPSA
jgi:hypothetical protein